MDVWIVAAAAGAGYVAQRLKNLTRGKHGWPDSSSENNNFLGRGSSGNIEVQGKSYIFHRLSGKPFPIETYREREHASAEEMASTRGFEGETLAVLDNCGNCSAVSISSSSHLNDKDIQGDWEGSVPLDFDSVNTRDLLPQSSSREMGLSYGFRRNRSSLRTRRLKSHFIKPQTSLESCLIAQLYKEHAEIEEYTYYEHPPNKPTVRPFLVSDGSIIISRKSRESLLTEARDLKSEKDTCVQDNKNVLSVPRLPNVVRVELQKKIKAKRGKKPVSRSETREMGNHNHSNAQGSSDGAFLFYIGLTMGIISSFFANKWELEKLNKLLKQSENLVQDLQEELEMKDSLTVNELAMEDYESRDLQNASYCDDAVRALALEQKLSNSRDSSKELFHQKPVEESMSKIEAELEAELERLESNINSSRLECKMSDMAELHPDFASDIIVGELRADLFGAKTGAQPYTDRDKSGSSTPHSSLYPVDPRELSLRLHQVIQSRLEERVKELETALQNSQRKVTEYENTLPEEFTNCKTAITYVDDELQSFDQPVVINLSGEALSAYNEAYEEFNKLSDSDEEVIDHQEIFHQCKQVIDQVNNGGLNGYLAHSILDRTPRMDISYGMKGDGYDDDVNENEDGDDEMERLLIRQIVEKARQGSPALLKAQRSLLLNDEI